MFQYSNYWRKNTKTCYNVLLGNKGAVLVVFDNEALELDDAIFVLELDQGRHLSGDVQRGRAVNRSAFPEDLLPQNRGRTEQKQHVEKLLAGFRFEIETFVSRVVLERGLEEAHLCVIASPITWQFRHFELPSRGRSWRHLARNDQRTCIT